MDKTLKIEDIIESGAHLGHASSAWNPKMKPYIFGERKGIHVIDPEKIIEQLKEACKFVRETIAGGKEILFVGTKPQIINIIEEEAKKCVAFYSSKRWLGGTLTNYVTIRRSVDKLKSMEEKKAKGGFSKLTKKENISIGKMVEKMHKNLDGVLEMNELPGALFVTDIKKDKNAVHEAMLLHIPVIAIVDTNVDPTHINYPIPANDDGVKSVKLIAEVIASAVTDGKEHRKNGKNRS